MKRIIGTKKLNFSKLNQQYPNHLPQTGPIWAGWEDKVEEYLYSSARNDVFDNQGCVLELGLLEPYLPGSSFV